MTVTADDLEAAVSTLVTTLGPATRRDWSAPAGAVEWDCWHTAEHIGDVLLSCRKFDGTQEATTEKRM